MGSEKTVLVVGVNDVKEEVATAAVITPGQFIERTSTGAVQRHSTAGGSMAGLIAKEDDLQGKGINDDYAVSTRVFFYALKPGDVVNALLKEGENAAIGNFLESAGDGDVQVHVADSHSGDSAQDTNITNQVKLQAIEAVDLSDSSGADPATRRILCEVV